MDELGRQTDGQTDRERGRHKMTNLDRGRERKRGRRERGGEKKIDEERKLTSLQREIS